MLIFAAAFSLVAAIFVGLNSQEPRVKKWFVLLCLSATALTLGLWMELYVEPYSFLAARINMTAGLVLATSGLVSARIMAGLPIHRPVLLLLATAALVNVSTVWLTDAYFTGDLIRYDWGIYVAGDPKFVLNPLLVCVIAGYGLAIMALHYRKAHPFDKIRIQYLFTAYALLSLSLLDYVPHFGIDLFGGPISGYTIPLFLTTFGYTTLRFRLLDYRSAIGLASGWGLALALAGAVYGAGILIARDILDVTSAEASVSAALAALVTAMVLSRALPQLTGRALAHRDHDFGQIVQEFAGEFSSIFDESLLLQRTLAVCSDHFGSLSAQFIPQAALPVTAAAALLQNPLIETEVYRRQHSPVDASHGIDLLPGAENTEIVIALIQREHFLGALALGRRSGDRVYGDAALSALRFLGNIVSIGLSNTRSALELEKRHQLDRYLAPQLVEQVLAGGGESILSRKRMHLTVFFSDLKDFTVMSDRMDPENLSTVLNEYLSDMADIAFAHGGTVDKFIGDAVMVFFGAPVLADVGQQVRQCVAMATQMHLRTHELNARWRAAGILERELVCRMGIHAGQATVGSFGSHQRVEYTAIGSAVNLAARLEGKCTPGHILLSAEAYRLLNSGTHEPIAATPRGEIQVKGFANAVEVYEIDPALASPLR